MSDLPRILLCSFEVIPGPSGLSRRITEYLKGLEDRFQVVVLCSKTPGHSHIERYHGARLLRVPVGSGDLSSRLMAFDRAVRRQIESEDYVLAHFTDPFGGYALCERRSEFQFRLLFEAMNFPSLELKYTHPQVEGDRRFLSKVRRQELYCLMNADMVVTGAELTRTFIHSLGVPDEQVRVLRSPVDLSSYSSVLMAKPDSNPMRVLYLGNVAGYQGLPTLLRALHHAASRADVRGVIVGPRQPEWQVHLDDLLDELSLRGKVEFQAPVGHDDLAKIVAASDVGVLPLDDVDRNQTQGGALAKASEYLAGGRPLVASDLPITRELLPASATVFATPGDFKDWGDKLVHLAKNPKTRVEMGARARSEALKLVDGALIRGQLIDLYDELLGRPSVPATSASVASGGDVPTQIGERQALGQDDATKQKTDPLIIAPAPPRTDQRAVDDRAPTPSSDAPVVLGVIQPADASNVSRTTEPDAVAPLEPPVVVGDLVPAPSGLDTLDQDAEPEEVSTDDILDHESEGVPAQLDPWFAQLAHGYCPPEVQPQTNRPPTPTRAPPPRKAKENG